MKATRFEYRYQTLIHLTLVGLAVLTYLIDPVDIVWGLIRHHADNRLLEHIVFGVGAIELLSSAVLETWAIARPYRISQFPLRVARFLLASAIGLLLPISGAIILVGGDAILAFRLLLRDREDAADSDLCVRAAVGSWGVAFRTAASKWGLALSMIVFAWTLEDRIVEIGAALSVIAWLALKIPAVRPA